MPKTLLAVDDSATMRKVLEITFSGDDFRVTSADGASGALARMGEDPAAVVIDTSLGADDGYALAKELRSRNARLAIVLMASRYSPYDAARGRDAGVDDFIDKPFDTQSLIDKVKKALVTREAARPASPAIAPSAVHATVAFGASPPRPPAAGVPGAPTTAQKPVWGTQRTHTLSFESAIPPAGPAAQAATPSPALSRTSPSAAALSPQGPAAVQPPVAVQTAPTVVPAQPAQPGPTVASPRMADAPRGAETAVSATAAAANGRLAAKLDELGLTSQQVEAVLALSREVVERVVWEVVPQLAEVMIKEEISRLTRDG
ncbi:MAG TPA: response regulator [Polyangiaceae bacterium]|nr:response regulator [Polyangiaceae bacterium]